MPANGLDAEAEGEVASSCSIDGTRSSVPMRRMHARYRRRVPWRSRISDQRSRYRRCQRVRLPAAALLPEQMHVFEFAGAGGIRQALQQVVTVAACEHPFVEDCHHADVVAIAQQAAEALL